MKKLNPLFLTSYFLLFTFYFSYSQSPQGFNYQAVARDGDNVILANATLDVKIGLLQGSATGTLVWEEIHSVTTSDLGLFALKIGDTDATNNGGTATTFSDINWTTGSYYMKVQVNDGGGYIDMGSTELLSVPYALFAEEGNEGPEGPQGIQGIQGEQGLPGDPATDDQTLSIDGHQLSISNGNTIPLPDTVNDADHNPTNEIQDLQLINNDLTITNNPSPTVIDMSTYLGNSDYWIKSGDTVSLTGNNVGIGTTSPAGRLQVMGETEGDEEPVFEVKNKDGQTVFAVYNNGVRVYVEDSGTKGLKGGFAVGGFNSSKGTGNEYLRVSNDSVRIYINEDVTKGLKGGFAVGGFNSSKGITEEYMNISAKTSAEVIDPSESRVLWYPKKEAFLTGRVLIESPDSVGTNSMATGFQSRAIGDFSQAMGYLSIARGPYATAIGREAVADTNAFAFGYKAKALANDAFAMGSGAYATGEKSFALGSTGIDENGNPTTNTIASGAHAFAIGLGNQAQGKGSTALGANTYATGDFSSTLGYKTSANGKCSMAIGYQTYADGNYSQALGYQTNASNDYSFVCEKYNNTNYMPGGGTGGYLFVIGNGEWVFPNPQPTRRNAFALYSGGELLVPGIYNTTVSSARDVFVDSGGKMGYITSSIRYKENIINMENIDWIYNLRPVNFNYKTDETLKKQYGLIAEEVEDVNPSFVSYNNNGEVETVLYSRLVTPILKALQEQKDEISRLNQEIDKLKNDNSELALLKEQIMELRDSMGLVMGGSGRVD
ncbi:MAG: tail fiber domain-containing protein [Bacteroidales bacterium]|nr:tail fiber domain-containing protein [Bacteroidales bacterium]